MAGYLGNIPTPQATQTRDTFTATSGQTSFATSGYTVGMLDFYLNGIKLASADFTASNGSDVVLASGASTGDILEVVSFATFESDSGSFTGAVTVGADLTIGDASASDRKILFDGNAQDFHIGLDDSTDSLTIGLGSTLGTTSHIIIDANGHITKPLQSAFNAHLSSQQNNIAVNTNVTIQFATERFDQNADYDNSTYTFTAPVTGRYQLNATVYLMNVDTGASYYSLQLITSNDSYFATFSSNSFQYDADYLPFQISQLVDMDANDTAYVRVYQSNGSVQTDVNSNSFFSGFLAC